MYYPHSKKIIPILYFYPVNFLSEGCELTFILTHALSLFVLKTEMVSNARINLKPPSFMKKYYDLEAKGQVYKVGLVMVST